MSSQEKAKQLFDIMSSQTYTYQPYAGAHYNVEEIGWEAGKKCALIAVEKEYHSLRELLFNLRSSHVIENEKVYLSRLDNLTDEEKAVKAEIERL